MYKITFRKIEEARSSVKEKAKLLNKMGLKKDAQGYETLVKVYDVIESFKLAKAKPNYLVLSIKHIIEAHKKVGSRFVANYLNRWLISCKER